jgi:16S rRNA (adenine1518-N6/adenine1519-N6)-dimethyltransferase
MEPASQSGPRQTLSYLRGLFQERGIRPRSKLGQNFLIDLNLLDLLLRAAELTPRDLAIEVGTGTGSLTARLAAEAGRVLAVEIDPAFYALTSEAIAEKHNVVLLHSDILQNKNELKPAVLAALAELRRRGEQAEPPFGQRLKLVANLPYAVATPVLSNFLLSDLPFERMVTTVQWEIAERLTAQPGTRDYSALSVLVQSLADIQLVRRLPPAVFWPRPQVASAIVRIRPRADKRAHVGDVIHFRNFLRDLYSHRRKNLRGALAGWPSGRRAKAEVDHTLAELGLDGTIRAEDLDLEQHLRLSKAF